MKSQSASFLILLLYFLARVVNSKIPNSVLYDMRDIHSLPDLLRSLPIDASNDIHPRGNRPNRPTVPDSSIHVFTRNQVSTFHQLPVDIAELPGCEPRPAIVKTESLLETSENTIFWPHCLNINRCGGCCNNDLFECVAVETRQRTEQLLRMGYDPQGRTLILDGVTSVDIQEDIECACRCKVRPSECRLDREVFTNCQCQCLVELICPPNFRWDPVTCDCVCGVPHAERSCRSKRETFNSTECGCSCDPNLIQKCHDKGLRFNHERCRCISRSRYDLSDTS